VRIETGKGGFRNLLNSFELQLSTCHATWFIQWVLHTWIGDTLP